MKLRLETMGTVQVISPAGPVIEEDLEAFVEAVYARLVGSTPRLVINMAEVPYLDSRGLETLVDLAGELRRSLPLKLAALTMTCREILDLTELGGEFEVFEDVEGAVRSFLPE